MEKPLVADNKPTKADAFSGYAYNAGLRYLGNRRCCRCDPV